MSLTAKLGETAHVDQMLESVLLGASSRLPHGTNVFSRDWDLLVILDTCRYDALSQVAPEFEFIDEINQLRSLGSSTREWTANTFTSQYRDEVQQTAFVCGNGQVTKTLEAGNAMESPLAQRFTSWNTLGIEEFHTFDSIPNYAPTDPYGGITLPCIVTDRAIRVGRQADADRLMVHYVPPHNPYRATALGENRALEPYEHRPFEYLRNGGDKDLVWDTYLDELRWVLEDVKVLLNNLDAERAVITADHGELFGHLGLYSHPTGVPHPHLRRVPWVETTATDTNQYEPHYDKSDKRHTASVTAKQLEYLGYR